MSSPQRELHFFLGANTPQGFISRFDQLCNANEGWRSYVIKGGPGSGKSTLMKKAAQSIGEYTDAVELIHCSSDVDSLDAVIFEKLKLSIVDGTPPHGGAFMHTNFISASLLLSAAGRRFYLLRRHIFYQ